MEKQVKRIPWQDYLPVIGLGFTAIFWTLDNFLPRDFEPIAAKRYLLILFAVIWGIAAALYTTRVVKGKVQQDPALAIGAFLGMMVGELMAIWPILQDRSLAAFRENSPFDIGGGLWADSLVRLGILFAAVGLGIYVISLFPAWIRRNKKTS